MASELPGGHEGQDWVVVQGIIDACFLEDGGWVLLDYKTDMVFGSPKEAAEAHRPQLLLYARALQEGTGARSRRLTCACCAPALRCG